MNISPLAYVLLIMALFGRAISTDHLCRSSCGDIDITSPFRLTTDPLSCGDERFDLSCENNTAILYLPVGHVYADYPIHQRYNVLAINYHDNTIRLGYPDLDKNDCSSIPIHGVSSYKIREPQIFEAETVYDSTFSKNIIFLNCEIPILNTSYIEASSPCTPNDTFSEKTPLQSKSQHYTYYYTYFGYYMLDDLPESCGVLQVALISARYKNSINNSNDVHNALLNGFEISWWIVSASCFVYHWPNDCGTLSIILAHLEEILFRGRYYFVAVVIAQRIVIGVLVLVALLIYIWRKQHLSIYDSIEVFLRSQNNLMPIRYSYRDIKKMTKGFKDKLGEGGFGSVYKGKLRSGRFVAIKMLSNSKASGQDFINEVATIGRIHHVNVVRLIGFSVEGSKRALVYDFMPNGSLDKFIFSRDETQSALGSKEMFEISIGIARGIEYLHQGCDMTILHFDIKPHNILLDENFIPKVSDFGLARLCPSDNSMVSLTAARGTLGYMAPELYYKNIGGVSHKADVYSFGMLLMEMANQRRNLNAEAERTSQIYFPKWIFNQLSEGHDMEIENATEEESKIIKKMMIIALWCIQLKPCDRPSMDKAIKMLEGEVESLEMPPKLYLYPQESHEAENAAEMSSTLSNNESDEITLISNSY